MRKAEKIRNLSRRSRWNCPYAMCTLYNVHKEYSFCTQILYISKYNSLANVQRIDYAQYTIQNTHMLYAVCEVFSVLAIHYTGYIINI